MGFFSSGAGAFAGGLIDTAVSAWQAERNQDFAEKQMKNAWQWKVADMKKAGINPMLGLNASPGMPSGSSQVVSRVGEGASKVLEAQAIKSQVALNSASAARQEADAAKARGETLSPGVADQVARASAGLSVASASRADQEVRNLQASVAEIEARVKELTAGAREKNVTAATKEGMQAALVEIERLNAVIKGYQSKQESVKAQFAGKVGAGMSTQESLTEKAGHYLGREAADARDRLQELKENLKRVWGVVFGLKMED